MTSGRLNVSGRRIPFSFGRLAPQDGVALLCCGGAPCKDNGALTVVKDDPANSGVLMTFRPLGSRPCNPCRRSAHAGLEMSW